MATFTNTATLSYNGITTSSNTTVGEILEQLSVTKTAVRPVYSADDDITYVVSLINSGTTDLTGLTLTDDLGSYTFNTQTVTPLEYVDDSIRYYSNGSLQAALTPTVTANSMSVTGITVPAGGNALIVYEAKPNSYASPEADGSILNTVTVTGGGIAAAVTDTETVNAEAAPVLSIDKAMSPTVVSENGRLTYTLTIRNSGNEAVTATDDVIVTDVFDPVLSDISVTFNGTAWTAGTNYTYNTATGEFATVAGQITVPAATFTQNTTTGEWSTTPGTATIVISGTV